MARQVTRPTFAIDDRPENADWMKQAWDIPAHSVPELRRWIKAQRMTVAQFKRLPVYRFNVDQLDWLKEL